AAHRCAPDLAPAPPRAVAGTGPGRSASTCAPEGSFSPEHLDPTRRGDANVDLVERGQYVAFGGLAIRCKRRGVAGTRKSARVRLPPELAWEVGADRGNRRHRVPVAEHYGADAARHDVRARA